MSLSREVIERHDRIRRRYENGLFVVLAVLATLALWRWS